MRDINTIYREEVATANKEYTKTVGDSVQSLGEELRKGMEIIRLGMEKFAADITQAAQTHLTKVSASEISWTANAEIKMAQFQGVSEIQVREPPAPPEESTKQEIVVTTTTNDDDEPVPAFLTRKRLPQV